MELIELTSKLYVAAQIAVSDVEAMAAKGIRTIISNRPDCESADQPETQVIADTARQCGVRFVHIPVVSGAISDANIDDFETAIQSAEAPILAYCRTGTRSTMLWALMTAKSQDVEDILSTAQHAGYDLAPLRSRLQGRQKKFRVSNLDE